MRSSLAGQSNWGKTQLSPGLFTLWVWDVILGQHGACSCLTPGPHWQLPGSPLVSQSPRCLPCMCAQSGQFPTMHLKSPVGWWEAPWERGAPSEARAVPCSGAGSAGLKLLSTRMCIALLSLFTVPQTHYIPRRVRVWVSLPDSRCPLGSKAA